MPISAQQCRLRSKHSQVNWEMKLVTTEHDISWVQRNQAHAEGDHQMPLKLSGKVSGILDDLSDAKSLLHELLPSNASETNLQVSSTCL